MLALVVAFGGIFIGQLRVEPDAIASTRVGETIEVVGVFGSQVGTGTERILRLQRSNVKFVVSSLKLPDFKRKQNLRIVGVVEKSGSEIMVLMSECHLLPSDAETFDARASKLAEDDAVGWIALADWARIRKDTYQSEGLEERFRRAYDHWVTLERKRSANNPVALRALYERLVKDGLVQIDDLEIVHEILQAEWKKTPTDPASQKSFADRIRRVIAGKEKLAPVAPEIRERYRSDPLLVFRNRGEAERFSLLRYFEVWVRNQSLEEEWKAGSKDVLELAQEAFLLFADYPDVTQEWVGRVVADVEKRAGTFTRTQMERISDKIERNLHDDKSAKLVRRRWLMEREKSMLLEEEENKRKAEEAKLPPPPGDASLRLELAENYEEWFPGDAQAKDRIHSLLTEALSIEPSLSAAKEKLKKLGLDIEPTPSEDKANNPRKSVDKPALGMTAQSLRRAFGEPDSRSAIITKKQSLERWVYVGLQETTLVTLLETKDREPIVTGIQTLPR